MRVVDIVRGNGRQPQATSDLDQHLVAQVVLRHPVMPELDVETAGEELTESGCSFAGSGDVTPLRCTGHRPLPAAGECDEVTVAGRLLQLGEAVDRPILLPPVLAAGDEAADRTVSIRVRRQQD